MKSILLLPGRTLLASVAMLSSIAQAAIEPASFSRLTNDAASGGSYLPAITADGRFVFFVSEARNLVSPVQAESILNIYRHDRLIATTVRLSTSTNGLSGGNGHSWDYAVSTNGQRVAFTSAANDLVLNDSNRLSDIFLRDLPTAATRLVSMAPDGAAANGASASPLLSQDGRWVVFESKASNLVSSDLNGTTDIFLCDLESNVTVAVSVSTNGVPAHGRSESAAVTRDARFVTFVSTANDLVADDANSFSDVYVRDMRSGVTRWASRAVAGLVPGASSGYRCSHPALSDDGRSVAFKCSGLASNAPVSLLRYDTTTDATILLSSTAYPHSRPQMSGDGRWIAGESNRLVVLWDIEAGTNVVVSVDTNGLPATTGISHTPVMTPDARRVVFISSATDLTAESPAVGYELFAHDLVAGVTRLVSVRRDGARGTGRSADISVPAISADGTLVAFDSTAIGLVVDDHNDASDVFVRDLATGTTTLISIIGGEAAATASGLARLGSLSRAGHRALFSAFDGNLVPDDHNEIEQYFVSDLLQAQILPVGVSPTNFLAGTTTDPTSAISECGRYVFYAVYKAANTISLHRHDLVDDLTEPVTSGVFRNADFPHSFGINPSGTLVAVQKGGPQIYLIDMLQHTQRLVSVSRWTGAEPYDASFHPLLTRDSRWVLFLSHSGDLTTNRLNHGGQLFARDISKTNVVMRLVSATAPGGPSLSDATASAVTSTNSQFVAFGVTGVVARIYRHDLGADVPNLEVCSNCMNPAISGEGRYLSYLRPQSPFGSNQIYVLDLHTGLEELISTNYFGPGGCHAGCQAPSLSPDARFVVFASAASDLVANDTNRFTDIFVRDRLIGTTALLSLNRWGTGSGNGPSTAPTMSVDGRTVVFQSTASDLVANDFNDRRDVFVVRLPGADRDGDGLDDDWELAYFSTLARDGSGDYDGDGLSDRNEFLAGTDPTNQGSVLRVLIITLAGGHTTVAWSAVGGRSYHVEATAAIAPAVWTNVSGMVTASTPTASWTETNAAAGMERFYRVVVDR